MAAAGPTLHKKKVGKNNDGPALCREFAAAEVFAAC
jgi:hypothetical protein